MSGAHPRCRAACCAVVTTAEYCTEVIGALARNVAKLLDPPLGDEVSLGFGFGFKLRRCAGCRM